MGPAKGDSALAANLAAARQSFAIHASYCSSLRGGAIAARGIPGRGHPVMKRATPQNCMQADAAAAGNANAPADANPAKAKKLRTEASATDRIIIKDDPDGK